MTFDFKKIKKLIELVENADISELAVDDGTTKIEIHKKGTSVQPIITPSTETEEKKSVPEDFKGSIPIKSPMVGTFYTAASPDAPPFIKIGDQVEVGQIVCIVEAMKLFNEIESEVAGTVEKILVKNAQSVDFGQPLLLIKKD